MRIIKQNRWHGSDNVIGVNHSITNNFIVEVSNKCSVSYSWRAKIIEISNLYTLKLTISYTKGVRSPDPSEYPVNNNSFVP